jgi:hypothetical protein
MASFLNPLSRSFAGEIREREPAVIYHQPAKPSSTAYFTYESGYRVTLRAANPGKPQVAKSPIFG